jgi:hypothetical protein
MKKLLATTAAALAALTIATPAQAALSEQDLRFIGRSLSRAGVSIDIKETCKPGLAGWYESSTKQIAVCINNLSSTNEVDELIAHESIHAAQHCVGAILDVPGLMPIAMLLSTKPELSDWWLRKVNGAVTVNARGIAGSSAFNTRGLTPQLEREAYAMESNPMEANRLFRAACLGE